MINMGAIAMFLMIKLHSEVMDLLWGLCAQKSGIYKFASRGSRCESSWFLYVPVIF